MSSELKYQYIDALRGLAILMVIMLHTSWAINALTPLNSTMALFANYCQMGVQLFFVASAYTLSMSYVKRSSERFNLIAFYIRRVFRIAPLYYVGIATYFFLKIIIEYKHGNVALAFEAYTFKNVLANIFLVHGFIPTAMNSVVHGGWSIGAEMIFYMIFPLIFFCSKQMSENSILSTCILFALSVLLNALIQIYIFENYHQSIIRNNHIYFSIFNQLPVFILGILAYYIFEVFDIKLSQVLFLAGFTLFTLLTLLLWTIDNQYHFAIIPTFSGISFVFLLGYFKNSKANYFILAKIGNVSYSMYIFHFIFSWNIVPAVLKRTDLTLDANILSLMAFILCVGCSYIFAQLSAKLVEKQGISFGAKVIAALQNK